MIKLSKLEEIIPVSSAKVTSVVGVENIGSVNAV